MYVRGACAGAQQRKAEDAEMLRQVEELIAANARMRQILVDKGIMPPEEGMAPGRPLNS